MVTMILLKMKFDCLQDSAFCNACYRAVEMRKGWHPFQYAYASKFIVEQAAVEQEQHRFQPCVSSCFFFSRRSWNKPTDFHASRTWQLTCYRGKQVQQGRTEEP